MRLARIVVRQALVWSGLVIAGAAVLAALATTVDGGAGLGVADALQVGVLRVPGLLLPLLPALCGLAAGVAAGRQAARGERLALELAGHVPTRIAGLGLIVGLGLGCMGWAVHGQVVPAAEARADHLGGVADAPWVFVDGDAIRVRDGLVVRLEENVIVGIEVSSESDLRTPALREAAARQRPARASGAVLASATGTPARVERMGRQARVLAAALLAFVGWLPLARVPASQVGVALVGGLSWASADVVLRAAAAQGRVGPTVGAWGATLLVLLLVGAAVFWVRRSRGGVGEAR
jgi:lipopolysaccharide export LptBFGC system permease protein LptF